MSNQSDFCNFLTDFFTNFCPEEEESFKRRFFEVLSSLSPEDQENVQKLLHELVKGME